MTKIIITGGTGLIGRFLSTKLMKKGYKIAILSRTPKSKNEFKWDVSNNYIDPNALKNTSYIIHLAGENIASKKWSKKQKKKLIDSRVKTTKLLFKKIIEYKINLKGFISASGIGYYGSITSKKIFSETDKPGKDFIANICIKWEKSANLFKEKNITVSIIRTGMVLSSKGGALKKMNTPFFLSVLGKGSQFIPWIHIKDLCNIYIKIIENPNFNGIYNAVAPNYITNSSFIKILAKVTKKNILPIKIPSFILKLIFGEMSNIILYGSRISTKKIKSFYTFKFPNLKLALKNIF